jgi:hypothetical protein
MTFCTSIAIEPITVQFAKFFWLHRSCFYSYALVFSHCGFGVHTNGPPQRYDKYCTKSAHIRIHMTVRRYLTEELSVSLFLRISKFFLTYSHSRLVTEVQLYLSVVCDVCIYEQLVFFDKSIEPSPKN